MPWKYFKSLPISIDYRIQRNFCSFISNRIAHQVLSIWLQSINFWSSKKSNSLKCWQNLMPKINTQSRIVLVKRYYNRYQICQDMYNVNWNCQLINSGLLGCREEWLLCSSLLRSSSSIWYENHGHLSKRSDSSESTIGLCWLLLSMLFTNNGSISTAR